ncbi:MAG: fused MFS/spermidine synthase [Myxococcales bacterium]
MVVEILGTRIIGPVFGVGLFVWSALLAVTLGSLASGYYIGGVLVDRMPTRRLMGMVVVCAGALLGLVPVLDHVILGLAEGLGPRGGPLVSATALFTPCLVALGMIGPVAVRLSTTELQGTGHRVGSMYAVSTAGSLLGTLVTAFLLIPSFDTDHILFGTSSFLVVVGTVPFLRARNPVTLLALLIPLFGLAVPDGKLPPGLAILARSQSLYGLLEVVDDANRNVRFLRADHSVIGGEYTRDHSPCFGFISVLESVRVLRPAAKDLLQIGLGIGSLPSALKPYGIKMDVVEIDPAVVRLARDYFAFSPTGDVHIADARSFLRETNRRYDAIVHDTFTGGTTPEHLLSLEVVQRIRELLRPDGLLVLNFAGYYAGPKAEASFAVARTLRAVFSTVRSFRDSALDVRPGEASNLIFFASDGALDFERLQQATSPNPVAENILRSFFGWEVLKEVPAGPVITDGRNPLARLQLPIAEEHFKDMNQLLPRELWLK